MDDKPSFFFYDELEKEFVNKASHTKGNKGEWSEVYTMFKLLGDGKLYDGDESYNKISDSFYPILQVIREELLPKQKNEYRYKVEDNCDAKTIAIYENNELLMNLTSDNFMAASTKLLEDIRNGEGRSFKTSAVNEAFMKKIHCRNIKRGADHKADIVVHLYDARTQRKPILAFSIKSLIGGAPTLLNTSDATLITYSVNGHHFTDEEISEINSITGNSKLKKRIKAIFEKGATIKYKTFDHDTFLCNLQTIDFGLPIVLAESVLSYFSSERVSSIKDISKKITPLNLLNYKGRNPENFYTEKMVKLLIASALGMYPSKTYSGENEANGYIVVKEDGELVCYHFYDIEMVKSHLLDNTKFDTPASKKKAKMENGSDGADQRKPYCILYRNEVGEVEIKLNFQIRWK